MLVHRYGEVDPPRGEDDQQPARRDGQQLAQRLVLVDRGLDRHRGRGDRLAEHDDGEQAVPLHDVVRVPGRLVPALGDHRNPQLGDEQHEEQPALQVVRDEQQADPAQLADHQSGRVLQRRRPGLALLPGGGSQPLRRQGDAHDDVAGDRDRPVVVVEGPAHPGRVHEHTGDLHERRDPVRDVVHVVRRGEPGEVHPGPPHAEEDEEVADHPGAGMALRERVHQPGAGLGDGDDEAEVEEQLQRGGGTVELVGAASSHGGVGHTGQETRGRDLRQGGRAARGARVPRADARCGLSVRGRRRAP